MYFLIKFLILVLKEYNTKEIADDLINRLSA